MIARNKRLFLDLARRASILASCAVLLAACVTPQLSMSGETVAINELRCNADKSVTATATLRIPGALLQTGGAILHSPDSGLTWSIAASGERLGDVTPWFFTDSRDGPAATRPLIVTGYKSSGLLEWTYQLAGWMQSTDAGRTWAEIAPRLPFVGSRDPIDRPPPLVVVDATGRLATLRRAPSPALLISDDQGATWSETRLPEIDFHVYHLHGNGRGRLVVVGRASPKIFGADRLVVVQSDDSGKTWSIAMNEAADHLSCNPRMIGNADGAMLIYNPCPDYGKRYYLSADGGRTWQARVFFKYAFGALELVTALDSKRWVALSREGQDRRSLFAWISDNGGVDWRGQKTGFAILSGNPHLMEQAIVALPDGVVLAYVSDGQVLRSADRGETWKLIDSGLPRNGTYYLGASCTDGHGLVVLGGGQGMVARSPDGGLTWERGRLPRMNP